MEWPLGNGTAAGMLAALAAWARLMLEDWPQLVGYAAVTSSVITCSMKTMVPLRVVSMICNSCFIIFAIFHVPDRLYPTLVLNLILLPLNAVRLHQMVELVNKIEAASKGDLSIDWLKPFMFKRTYAKGDILFHKGEAADMLFYTVTGLYRLVESNIDIPPNRVVGELGLLAPGNQRTQTLECVQEGEVLAVTYPQVKQLYYQNPKFGFYFLQLISERLFHNVARLEEELAHKSAELQRARA